MGYILGSLAIGAVVGLISATNFAIILRRMEQDDPDGARKALIQLLVTVLGSGLGDFIVFDIILGNGVVQYYMLGAAALFLPLAIWVFIRWMQIKP